MHRVVHESMHRFAYLEAAKMRTTIKLDMELLEEAGLMTGIKERTALIHAGLRALIERESARRLALLGGSEPRLKPISRRRPKSE